MTTELDGKGLFIADPGAIRTFTGGRVNPLTMTADDVSIIDIARALSAQCRYNGHCFGHLSVARHSLWVAEELAGQGAGMQLAGLLHDAAEAYLGDLVRPLKHTAFGDTYLAVETYAEGVIFGALGVDYPLPEAVSAADDAVLQRELADMRWTYNGSATDDELEFLRAYNGYRLGLSVG